MQKIYNFYNCFDTIQGRLYQKNSPSGIAITSSTSTRLAPATLSGSAGSVFVTFNNQNSIPFPAGTTVSLSGVLGALAYNGTFSVTTASITGGIATVGWSSSASGGALFTSSEVKFVPENKIILSTVANLTAGMTVVGTGISASATISSIFTSSNMIVLSVDNTDKILENQYFYLGRNTAINTNTQLDCLNVFKRKVISSGLSGDPTKDTITQLQNAFNDALAQSPNSEEVVILEDPSYQHRICLITELSTKWNSDIKNLAIPFSSEIDVGKTIDWLRTGYKYLVLTQNLTQKAYFSGTMHQCNFLLKWKDSDGNLYSQYVVVDGPTEKDDDYIRRNNVMFDTGNAAIQIFIAKTPALESLIRYSRVLLNGRSWEIVVINNMENENIATISLKENYINADLDDVSNNIAENQDVAVIELQSLILNDLS